MNALDTLVAQARGRSRLEAVQQMSAWDQGMMVLLIAAVAYVDRDIYEVVELFFLLQIYRAVKSYTA